jgi:hypothetical protein
VSHQPLVWPLGTSSPSGTRRLMSGKKGFGSSRTGSSIAESDELSDFTSEAQSLHHQEVQRFAEKLQARARARTAAEVVVKDDVAAAAKAMRPAETKDSLRLISDWVKRIGILFIGFAVTQFLRVHAESRISQGSVNWLLADAIIAVALLVVGLVLDRTSLRGN